MDEHKQFLIGDALGQDGHLAQLLLKLAASLGGKDIEPSLIIFADLFGLSSSAEVLDDDPKESSRQQEGFVLSETARIRTVTAAARDLILARAEADRITRLATAEVQVQSAKAELIKALAKQVEATADDSKRILAEILGELRRRGVTWAINDADNILQIAVTKERQDQQLDSPSLHGGEAVIPTRFKVALSFPGEHRTLVASIADELSRHLMWTRVFYDRYFKAELARPNVDTYLQKIYHDDAQLIVVFICEDYNNKEWCHLEARAIRDLIKKRRDDEIMFIRVGDGDVDGVFSVDGYIDADGMTPSDIANEILKRLAILG